MRNRTTKQPGSTPARRGAEILNAFPAAQRSSSAARVTARPQSADNWLANAAHSITHFGSVELVDIEEAAYRLYVRRKRAPMGVERMPTLGEMRRVYDRTKGQVFVLDRAFDGMPDHGPLFVWDSLWHFAGRPEKGERPTWRLPKGAFSDMPAATSCTPGRCLFLVRDYVKKLRGATARAEEGAAKAA